MTMHIEFNGKTVRTKARTVAEFLAEQNINAAGVATAVDGDFVPRVRLAQELLREGSKLEVLAPMQGG